MLLTDVSLRPDKYAVRFIPRENGIHTIDVKFNGSHIPGSPFQIRVGEPGQTGEPGLVSAYGAGLERGTTGEMPVSQPACQPACFRNTSSSAVKCFLLTGSQSEFIINNTKAGPGSLAVSIEGPSKVKMDCQEVPEGYKVLYTPMAPGTYLISIKYGGPNHISGSPFKAKVTGKAASGSTTCWPAARTTSRHSFHRLSWQSSADLKVLIAFPASSV